MMIPSDGGGQHASTEEAVSEAKKDTPAISITKQMRLKEDISEELRNNNIILTAVGIALLSVLSMFVPVTLWGSVGLGLVAMILGGFGFGRVLSRKNDLRVKAIIAITLGAVGAFGGYYLMQDAKVPTEQTTGPHQSMNTPAKGEVRMNYGSSYMFGNKLAVNVGKPEPYAANDLARNHLPGAESMRFIVVMENRGSQLINVGSGAIKVKVDNEEATLMVYEPGKISLSPESLKPGEKKNWYIAVDGDLTKSPTVTISPQGAAAELVFQD